MVVFLNFWGQIFNNAHCLSLYSSFVSFVFLAALMTVWPQKFRNTTNPEGHRLLKMSCSGPLGHINLHHESRPKWMQTGTQKAFVIERNKRQTHTIKLGKYIFKINKHIWTDNRVLCTHSSAAQFDNLVHIRISKPSCSFHFRISLEIICWLMLIKIHYHITHWHMCNIHYIYINIPAVWRVQFCSAVQSVLKIIKINKKPSKFHFYKDIDSWKCHVVGHNLHHESRPKLMQTETGTQKAFVPSLWLWQDLFQEERYE